jgi:TolB-like protein
MTINWLKRDVLILSLKLLEVCLTISLLHSLYANVTVAISSFKNESGQFYLDSWEKSVPDMLKGELSSSDDIIVLERQALEDILTEQAISLTGLVDSTTVQRVGKLLGAEYIINGTISSTSSWIRIDVNVIRVETGQLRSESVRAQNHNRQHEMMHLLGHNIRFMLSGQGSHKSEIKIKQYPTVYFFAATLVLGGSALWMDRSYREKYDAYHQTVSLNGFEDTYDEANRLHKIRNGLYGLTGVALAGTVYCLIRNMSPEKVLAQNRVIIPTGFCDHKGRFYAGFKIYF